MPPHAAEKLTLRNASPVMGRRRDARKQGPTSCVQSWSCAIDTALRREHICAKDIRLNGSGKKYDPPTLQQRFLFPSRSLPVTVTVTSPSGPAVSGELVQMDDFNVSLRDSSGEYHSWKRTPGLTIVKNDPLAGHVELLDKYTDKNIHDVVTYLETLK